ncbi:MAG: OadG family protein [Ignavibacteriales bacterium]|nr:OadG family protein [Ignavibacteriales bacterium]
MDTLNMIISDTLESVEDTVAITASNISEITFDLSKLWNSNGIVFTVIGYSVVFIALLLLFIAFKSLTKIISFNLRRKFNKTAEVPTEKKGFDISGDITAAISLALHLHFEEIHDLENTVITIKKIQKTYSPWSSKIYGLRQNPRGIK